MKEEDCYSARQKPSGGPFNLSILVVCLRKKKKKKGSWNIGIMTKATGKRGKNHCKKAYRWTQTKKAVVLGKCSCRKKWKDSQWIWMEKKQWTRNSMCCISKKRVVKISASERGWRLVHTAAHPPSSSVTYSLHWGRWSLFQVQHLYHVVSNNNNKKKKIERKQICDFGPLVVANLSCMLGQWWQDYRWLLREWNGLFVTGNCLKFCGRVALNSFQSQRHCKTKYLSL